MRMNEIKIVEKLDRGLAYAEACFETFRVLDGYVFQQVEHQRRLQYGLKTYGLIWTDAALKESFEQAMIAANVQGDDMLVRMTVSAGDTDWGLLAKQMQPHVRVQMMPLVERAPLHLQAVSWPFPLREKRVKYTADYAESLRAVQQWGLDNPMQALICSADGHVLNTLTANIAIYRHRQWVTPQGLGILHGIVRQFLLEDGVLIESVCPSAWLDDCEAMVCMNSGVFVQPVASIHGRSLHENHAAVGELLAAFDGQIGVPSMGVMRE
ncbi:MAG: aminotransferase class IV [Mariprofundaceae bacterium]|nr:aminotransferase class IV [Mariprofundaceae bacterium]